MMLCSCLPGYLFSSVSLTQASVIRIRWLPQSVHVVSACLDGVVRVWDVRSGECRREFVGHSDEILDMVLSG